MIRARIDSTKAKLTASFAVKPPASADACDNWTETHVLSFPVQSCVDVGEHSEAASARTIERVHARVALRTQDTDEFDFGAWHGPDPRGVA